jgi:RNA polymerase sigma-70 factor (ECF subfamily)
LVLRSRASFLPSVSAAAAEVSLAEVFQEHAPFAWRFLRRLGVPEADADDVCQEVFVTVYRRHAEFEGRSSMRTWIFGICVRLAADYRKRASRRGEVTLGPSSEPVAAPDQEHDLRTRHALAVLDRMLDALDDEKRAVFVMFEIEELAMADVAAAVGVPLQTAYSRLHAARREIEAAIRRLHAKGAGP